jgi:hypothetical protein
VQFHAATNQGFASPFGPAVSARLTSQGYRWRLEFVATANPLTVSAQFLGTPNLAQSVSGAVSIPRCVPELFEPDDGSLLFWADEIDFDWSSIPGATGYELEIRRISNPPATFVETTIGSIFIEWVPDLPGVYQWRVRATGPVASDWSETWTFTSGIQPSFTLTVLEDNEPIGSCVDTNTVYEVEVEIFAGEIDNEAFAALPTPAVAITLGPGGGTLGAQQSDVDSPRWLFTRSWTTPASFGTIEFVGVTATVATTGALYPPNPDILQELFTAGCLD